MLQIEFIKRITNGGLGTSVKSRLCQFKRACLAIRVIRFISLLPGGRLTFRWRREFKSQTRPSDVRIFPTFSTVGNHPIAHELNVEDWAGYSSNTCRCAARNRVNRCSRDLVWWCKRRQTLLPPGSVLYDLICHRDKQSYSLSDRDGVRSRCGIRSSPATPSPSHNVSSRDESGCASQSRFRPLPVRMLASTRAFFEFL